MANASFILSDLNTWGWIAIAFGTIEFLAAFSIWARGRLRALVRNLRRRPRGHRGDDDRSPAYPFWSLTLVAIDLLVIYGLVAYGGKPELAQ